MKTFKNTKKDIFENFKQLGWSFRHHGCGFYNFVKPDDKEITTRIWFPGDGQRAARVEIEFGDYNGGVNFDLDKCRFEWIDKTCISLAQKRIKNPPVFINFSNHE